MAHHNDLYWCAIIAFLLNILQFIICMYGLMTVCLYACACVCLSMWTCACMSMCYATLWSWFSFQFLWLPGSIRGPRLGWQVFIHWTIEQALVPSKSLPNFQWNRMESVPLNTLSNAQPTLTSSYALLVGYIPATRSWTEHVLHYYMTTSLWGPRGRMWWFEMKWPP